MKIAVFFPLQQLLATILHGTEENTPNFQLVQQKCTQTTNLAAISVLTQGTKFSANVSNV